MVAMIHLSFSMIAGLGSLGYKGFEASGWTSINSFPLLVLIPLFGGILHIVLAYRPVQDVQKWAQFYSAAWFFYASSVLFFTPEISFSTGVSTYFFLGLSCLFRSISIQREVSRWKHS